MDSNADANGEKPPESGAAAEPAPAKRVNPKSPREALAPEPAPAPPRSRSVRHPVVVALNALIMIIVLAFMAVGGVLYWGKSEFSSPGPLTAESSVIIQADSSLSDIAAKLEDEGVISNSLVFRAGVRAYQTERRLKAGEYGFKAGISMQEVMDLLVEGKAILHPFTVPEGLTSQQIIARLREEPLLEGEVAEVPPEGSLLPDTYMFTRGAQRSVIVERMRRAHDAALASVWERRRPDLPISTPAELVTLASIVEKETGRADERPRVAGVFINRLRQGMRLQSDPTIIYGLVGGQGSLGRPIRRSEIDRETPYNTYRINGLPPGPIANPGRAALEAVAGPSNTDELYFVADGTGGHAFSATLAEHNRHVARLRQMERAAAAAATDQVPLDELPAAEPAGSESAPAEATDLRDGEPARDPSDPILPQPRP